MSNQLSGQRRVYRSDQHVPLTTLIAAFPFLGFVSLSAGLFLALMLHWNWYLVILLPIVASGFVSGGVFLWVQFGKCRNAWLAGLLGAISGVIAFLASYYFSLCFLLGFQILPGVTTLPDYIMFRLKNDSQVDVGRPQLEKHREPSLVMNSFGAIIELGFLAALPMITGWTRSRRAFCQETNQWYQRETALLAPFSGIPLVTALDNGSISTFLATAPAGSIQQACHLTLEYVRNIDGTMSKHPVYLSVSDFRSHKPWYVPGKMQIQLLRQVEINPREISAVSQVFPLFASITKTSPSDDNLVAVRAQRTENHARYGLAEVVPVPEPYRQVVRTRAYPWIVNLHDLIPVAFLLGGLGMAVFGGFQIEKEQLFAGISLIVVGVAGIAWGLYTSQWCLSVYGNRWVESRLRSELSGRPGVIVDPRDPESRYVSIIPRDSFQKVKLVMSSDLLLLSFDSMGKRLLLEGDIDRYVIPFDSIRVCEPQCFFSPVDQARTMQLWVAQIIARFRDGDKELLISVAQTSFRPVNNTTRQRLIGEFCKRVKRGT
ncbi:MAG: hypothetical protein KDB01_27370 [Planctomycetaceae bacterium]|nr:hypothetical protein [Planctomycetaceae bacterium]